MRKLQDRLAGVSDSRGRIVSIFIGAVLLPSIALSVVSFNAVPKQREYLKMSLLQQGDQLLGYVEQNLEAATRRKALEAARAVGPERMLEGRPSEIRDALREAGMADVEFDAFRLEAWSSARLRPGEQRLGGAEMRALSDALGGSGPRVARDEDDAVALTTPAGEELGVVRFRFSREYGRRELVRRYFEREFVNPQRAWVIRLSEADGSVLYENAPSTSRDNFEVQRVMSSPSFAGVRLELRNRDRSIEQEVRRLAIAKTVLIGFIDLMLLAGLVLVFANVRRELHLSRLKSDFVANVSHELKTPLALIRLFAETLELGRVPNPDKARQYHSIINKESRRLTQLINNILDFSRIEAGRKEYRFVRGDVGAVVRDVIDAYRFPIEQQGFTLDVEVADDLPEMSLDPEALSQALHQPRQQRHQVQPGVEGDPRPRAARGRAGPGLGPRPGHRHPEDGAEEDLRQVLPRREQPGARRRRAAGWGSPSCATSWRPTAARSRWRARQARAALSRWCCRSRRPAPRPIPPARGAVR